MIESEALPNPATGARPTRETLQSVQVMRGIASLAVALYHTHLFISRPEFGSIQVFGSFAIFGWSGVNFFFVLSGFIIVLAHGRDIGLPGRAGNYIWRRFSRVYPVYWIFLTAYVVAAAFGLGSPDFSWAPRNLLSSYLLVQLGEAPTPPLKVAWTLFYEIAFYGAFLLLILNRRWGAIVLTLWGAAVFVDSFVLGRVRDGWYVHAWNFYFLIGALTQIVLARLDPRYGLLALLAGIALLVAAMAAGFVDDRVGAFQDRPLALVMLAVPFALILLGGAMSERQHGWKPSAGLMLLGEASFSIYLVHSAAISTLAPLLRNHAVGLPDSLRFLCIFVGAVVAGIIGHILVERPLLQILRRFGPGSRRTPSLGAIG